MSKRMTNAKIKEALLIKEEITERDRGFNNGVILGLRANSFKNHAGNEDYFWNGKYVNPQVDFEWGHNEGIDAVLNYKEFGMITEKPEDQQRFELRQKCFSLAQQTAPRRMNGAEPEPPAETIKRAMFLEHYFTTGSLLTIEAATGKAK